jgi:hypothetical protein
MASMSKEEREDMARSFAFFSAYSFLWKTDPNQATSSADEYWLAIIIGHSHTFYQRSSFRNLSFFECESMLAPCKFRSQDL